MKTNSCIALKMFLDILYSLYSSQRYKNVPIILEMLLYRYIKHSQH
jgi:hypothetical protein